MRTQNIILEGTNENLGSLFIELIEVLPEGCPHPFSSFSDDYSHIKLWPSICKVGIYTVDVEEFERGDCKTLNANLPSHRKHAINRVKSWNS